MITAAIDAGVKNQLISFNQNKTQITYHIKKAFTTNFNNPEEQVRATCFCELVLYYQYPVDQIQLEVPTKPSQDRIDLLVYKDNALKKPYLVVECKKGGISDAEFENAIEQAYRYANYLRAWYIMVIAGNKELCFNVKDYPSGERENNIISDLPVRFGEPPKYKYYKQAKKDLKIVERGELIQAFKKCHDTIWQGGKRDPTTAFDEMSKLLFCKLMDEKSTVENAWYDFQIGTNESPSEVFKRIETIYKKAKKEDEKVFKDDIHLPPEIVFSCLQYLQKFSINKIDLDAKGIAFEKFMQDFFKGQMGQFFTPRNIVRFIVDIMAPEGGQRVLDPASGSGGFLLNTMEYVRKYAENNYTDPLEIYDHWHKFAKDRLFGIEINDQIARVCKMNMILHGDGHSNIINIDSLHYMGANNKRFQKNQFDLILTNPPFGAMVKSSEKKYLKKFVLGNNQNKPRTSQKTEILFIELCVEFIKPGTGKIAMILPDGILNNNSLQYVRNYIFKTCQILAIISLPKKTFRHYGTGVKSSILVVRKKRKEETLSNYPIFMAIAEHVGYDTTGRETPDQNHLPEILKQYKHFEKNQRIPSSHQIFLINQDEIEGRIDPGYYQLEFIKNYHKVRNIPHKPLGELIHFSKETWNRKQQNYFINKFPYIEIRGIDIKTGEIKNISEMNISEAPSRAKMIVRENDILLSTTDPSRGAICFIDKCFDGFIASTGFAVIRKIKVGSLNRKYLFYALRFPSTLKQFEQRSTGGLYPIITKDELRKVLIPFPSKDIQIRIVAFMAYADALQKENEMEIKRLLNRLDSYVFEQLDIPISEIKQAKIFIVNAEDIKGKRYDVVEYNPFQFEFLNQLKNTIRMNKFIVDYKKGIEVGSKKYVSDGMSFVRVSDLNENNLNLKQVDKKISESLFEELKTNFCPKKGEILYTKDGTIGLNYLVTKEEKYIVSSAFLRLICKNIESAQFLKIILSLKIYREIANRKTSGTTIKHLNLKEFLNIPIPFPNKKKRNKIIREVNKLKAKVKSLKTEATRAIAKATEEVEEILFKNQK